MQKHNESYKLSLKKFFISGGMAGFLLLFRPILMMIISRGRDPNQYDAVDTSAMIQMIFTGIAFGVGLFNVLKSSFSKYILFSTPLRFLFYYSLLAMLSILWSINLKVSLFRAFETLAYQLLLIALFNNLIRKLNIPQIISWVLTYSVYIILLSTYRKIQWGGISFNLLFTEQFNSTPFFFIAMMFPVAWYLRFFILGASIGSQSNTAYAGMAAGLLTYYKGNKTLKLIFTIIVLALLTTIFFLGIENILQYTIFYGREGVGLQYTSGRNLMIEKSIPVILESPLWGYGFVAPEIQLVTQGQMGIIGVHNAILASMLGMGLPGLFLLILFFASMYKMAGSTQFLNGYQRIAFLGSVSIGLFHSIANPGIGSRMYGTWLPVVLIFTMIAAIHTKQKFEILSTTKSKIDNHENHLGHP